MGIIGNLLGGLIGSGLDIAGAGLLGRQSQGAVGRDIGSQLGNLLPFEKGGKVKRRKAKKPGRPKKVGRPKKSKK